MGSISHTPDGEPQTPKSIKAPTELSWEGIGRGTLMTPPRKQGRPLAASRLGSARKSPAVSNANGGVHNTVIAQASPLLTSAIDPQQGPEQTVKGPEEASTVKPNHAAATPLLAQDQELQGNETKNDQATKEQIPDEGLPAKYASLRAEALRLRREKQDLAKKMDRLEGEYEKQRQDLQEYPQKLSDALNRCRQKEREVAFLGETASILHTSFGTIAQNVERLEQRNVDLERIYVDLTKEVAKATKARAPLLRECETKDEEIKNLGRQLEEAKMTNTRTSSQLRAVQRECTDMREEMNKCRIWLDKALKEQARRDEEQFRFCDDRLTELLPKKRALPHLSSTNSTPAHYQTMEGYFDSPLETVPVPPRIPSLFNSPVGTTVQQHPPKYRFSPGSALAYLQSSVLDPSSSRSLPASPWPRILWADKTHYANTGPSRLSMEIAQLLDLINKSGLVIPRSSSSRLSGGSSVHSVRYSAPSRIQDVAGQAPKEDAILGLSRKDSATQNGSEPTNGPSNPDFPATPKIETVDDPSEDLALSRLRSFSPLSPSPRTSQDLENVEPGPKTGATPLLAEAAPSSSLLQSQIHEDSTQPTASWAGNGQIENGSSATSMSMKTRVSARKLDPIKTKREDLRSSTTKASPLPASNRALGVSIEKSMFPTTLGPNTGGDQDTAASSSAVEYVQKPGLRRRAPVSPRALSFQPSQQPSPDKEQFRADIMSSSPPATELRDSEDNAESLKVVTTFNSPDPSPAESEHLGHGHGDQCVGSLDVVSNQPSAVDLVPMNDSQGVPLKGESTPKHLPQHVHDMTKQALGIMKEPIMLVFAFAAATVGGLRRATDRSPTVPIDIPGRARSPTNAGSPTNPGGPDNATSAGPGSPASSASPGSPEGEWDCETPYPLRPETGQQDVGPETKQKQAEAFFRLVRMQEEEAYCTWIQQQERWIYEAELQLQYVYSQYLSLRASRLLVTEKPPPTSPSPRPTADESPDPTPHESASEMTHKSPRHRYLFILIVAGMTMALLALMNGPLSALCTSGTPLWRAHIAFNDQGGKQSTADQQASKHTFAAYPDLTRSDPEQPATTVTKTVSVSQCQQIPVIPCLSEHWSALPETTSTRCESMQQSSRSEVGGDCCDCCDCCTLTRAHNGTHSSSTSTSTASHPWSSLDPNAAAELVSTDELRLQSGSIQDMYLRVTQYITTLLPARLPSKPKPGLNTSSPSPFPSALASATSTSTSTIISPNISANTSTSTASTWPPQKPESTKRHFAPLGSLMTYIPWSYLPSWQWWSELTHLQDYDYDYDYPYRGGSAGPAHWGFAPSIQRQIDIIKFDFNEWMSQWD